MKSLWFVVSILFIALISTACQPPQRNNVPQSSSPQANSHTISQSEFEMPPSIPNMDTTSRTLYRHWNLVSFPVETTMNIQGFLETQDYANQIQSVWSWDASLGESGAWRVYPQSNEFEVLSTLSPDQGYWIRARNEFEFTGTGVTSNFYNFSEGWNLIGISHSQSDISVSEFFSQGDFWKDSCGTGATYESVWSWQGSTWKIHFAESGKLAEFNNQYGTSFEELTTLEAGMGVWIKTLRGNPPPPPEGCTQGSGGGGSTSLTGTWTGTYSWDCSSSNHGTEPIELVLTQNNTAISGTASYLNDTTTVTGGFVENTLTINITSTDTITNNQFTGTLTDGKIRGTTLNGENCSAATGPSGTFEITKQGTSDDHGNDSNTATVLPLDTSVTGNIEVAGDVDFFQFSVSETGYFTFESSGDLDTQGYVYDDAVSLITHDDDSGDSSNFKIIHEFEAGKTYYFKVELWDSNGTGEYQVLLTFMGDIQDDHGNDFGSSTSVSLDTVTSGNIELSNDKDVFSFTPATSDLYVFESAGSTFLNIELVDSDYQRIRYEANNKGDGNFLIYEYLNGGQTYFFEILGVFGTGPYTVTVKKSVDEHGNEPTAATPLELDVPVKALLNAPDDSDYFSFTPSSEGNYIFFTTETLDTSGTLYDSEENVLVQDEDSGFGQNSSLNYYLQANQTYYLKLLSHTQTLGKYYVFVTPQTPENLEGKWYNDHSKGYYQIASDNTLFTCSENFQGWSQRVLVGDLIFYYGEFRNQVSVLNNKLTFDTIEGETQFEAVSEISGPCLGIANTFFATPANYYGYWYSNAGGIDRYYSINENNVVKDCNNPQSDGSFGHSVHSGILYANVIEYPDNQLLLSLSGQTLTLQHQHFDSFVSYEKIETVPSQCETYFSEN